jgi:hypothetical protein
VIILMCYLARSFDRHHVRRQTIDVLSIVALRLL